MEALICRVCLKESDKTFNLFTRTIVEDVEMDYATMMMLCASVQVELEDEYPKKVCLMCFENMKQAFAFKVLCERSHVQLKETVSKEQDVADIADDGSEFENSIVESTIILTTYNTNEALEPTEHPVETATCEICDETFSDVNDYTRHLALHGASGTNRKRYNCALCNKDFKTTGGLKYHIECHKSIKRYKCTYDGCNWSFIAKQALDRHIMTHTDIKTCLCSMCGKAYATKDSLAHHVKTHSGLRPYKCSQCDKTYLQSSHLKKHELMHQGARFFTCESCGRSYSSSSQLKTHFRKFCGRGVKPVFKFKKNEKVEGLK